MEHALAEQHVASSKKLENGLTNVQRRCSRLFSSVYSIPVCLVNKRFVLHPTGRVFLASPRPSDRFTTPEVCMLYTVYLKGSQGLGAQDSKKFSDAIEQKTIQTSILESSRCSNQQKNLVYHPTSQRIISLRGLVEEPLIEPVTSVVSDETRFESWGIKNVTSVEVQSPYVYEVLKFEE
ncbi:hypothetical protein TNCV_4838391 [Trichonephila clavipes]|nr:hypothetical protein TNCV_4838391 [Trichonephila clavipes]